MTVMVNAFDILQDRIMRSRIAGTRLTRWCSSRSARSECSNFTEPTN